MPLGIPQKVVSGILASYSYAALATKQLAKQRNAYKLSCMTAKKTSPAPQKKAKYNPARAVAVRVLWRVIHEGAFAASQLDQHLRSSKLDTRDAGLATSIVYGTLRHIRSLKAALEQHLRGKTSPKAYCLLLAGSFEKLHLRTPDHAVVDQYVNLAKSAHLAPAGLVNAILRKVALPSANDMPPSELPDWLHQRYQQIFGQQTAAILQDLQQPQPLWLATFERGDELLLQQGQQLARKWQGLREIELNLPLHKTDAYQAGQLQPINPASLSCVDALDKVADSQVLDLAGGYAIKAAILAKRGAKVTSIDIAEHKLKLAISNLQRLGVADRVKLLRHDLSQEIPPQLASYKVLLDAPCTGSGTLRAHPEIALRLQPSDVTELAQLQQQMLQQAAKVVKSGGLLVYSVCSVLPEEGVLQIEQFLQSNNEFSALTINNDRAQLPQITQTVGHLTLPLDGIDGFYLACLQKA